MAFSVKHHFQSIKADGTDSTLVQPSNWNAEHDLVMATGKVLGRMTAASGPVEELPLLVDPSGQSLQFPRGTTAQRPVTPAGGMVRFNTTTNVLEAYQNNAWGNFADIVLSSQNDSTGFGRALGAGVGPPVPLTKSQLQRLIYNVGNAYVTFNGAADDGFILAYGQNISRTTYAALFAKWGTTYGAGDNSTTFGVPDLRGRVLAGVDNMGGTAAGRLRDNVSGVGTYLGGVGGLEYNFLDTTQIPAHAHSGNTSNQSANHNHNFTGPATIDVNGGNRPSGRGGTSYSTTEIENQTHYHSITTNNTGGGSWHNNTQPTMSVNWQIYTGTHFT